MNNGNRPALKPELAETLPLATADAADISAYSLLLRRRRFLLRSAGIGLVLFTAIAFLIPARYESVARLMPPERSELSMLAALSSRGADGLGLSMGLSSLLGLRTTGALFVGILSSNTVEDALIRRFDLRKTYGVRHWDKARKRLAGYSDISEDRKDGVITIRVRDHDPAQAQRMCQAYVDELNRLVVQLSTSSARREREFLQARLQLVKRDLDQASRDLSQFASQHTTIDIPQQGKAMVEAAALLQGQLIAAQSELKGLEQVYGPEHPRVLAVQARAAELRRQLDKLGGGAGAEANGDSLYPSIRQLPLLAFDYTEYYRRAKIQEALYESLTKQYEVAKVEEAKEIPTVRVLDEPTWPERHTSPPRLFIIFCGALVGFAAGIAIVLGRTAWLQSGSSHPRKVMALETWAALKEDAGAVSRLVLRRGAP